MDEILIALIIFLCLAGAAFGSLWFYERRPPLPREEETHAVVRGAASIFIVLTSLVLSLMINSARNRFDAADQNVHAFAINLILLDRALRAYGPEADAPRKHLLAYAERLWESRRGARQAPSAGPAEQSAEFLRTFSDDMHRFDPRGDPVRTAVWREAQQVLQKLVALRWTLIEQSEGTIPMPLLALMVAWLMLIFAGLAYRAPPNMIVQTTLVLSAALIAGSIYLILDMDKPFAGPIHISSAPLERALAEMRE